MPKKPIKFLFVGRTATGKSSIAEAVSNKMGLRVVKSYTTRPPRESELFGRSDHYFVSDEEFDEIGSVLKIKELQDTKEELFKSLEMFYKVFYLGEETEE